MRHAEVIGRLIRECLTEADIAVQELSGIVGGMGPGPFTGLRVGIAAARVFAVGAGKPLVPVVSHDAIAFGHYAAGHEGPLVVVTDARRREVYWSAYNGADAAGLPERIGSPGLTKPAALLDPAETDPHRLYAWWPRLDAPTVSAGDLGMVAELSFAAGKAAVADAPLYLRSPDVTLPNGRKRVS